MSQQVSGHGAAAADVQRREALLVTAVQIRAGLREERHDRELVADSSMVCSGPSLARHTGAHTPLFLSERSSLQ